MPVEPIPCADGGGTTPIEVTTCCAPSVASAPLCRADGSTVLLVVRSGCVECGEAPGDPEAVGWIDAATGAFTAGLLPADAGACDAGCVDTVCRQLCDDTDGDGAADATYSELWCIRGDGTAELVLTYQDDPSAPYTPVAPVECAYGCPDSETVTLCDDTGPFLRRYTWLQGTASFEDFDLDGMTPHVVTGTVGVCDASSDCEAPTTPAATLGLCLADGTPIAILITRDCAGTVTQDGWLNLTTGTYSAGDPPTGVVACGGSRSISVAGTFCDVDPGTGDVLGLVLVEYSYGPDGDVESVRLVDAVTGQTYVPQGEVTTCPAGVAQPERDVLRLCDTATDGTVTEFVRDYARDETGTITGHTDYLLDGTAYTPTGTVGRCAAAPCTGCETVLLCDTNASPPATIAGTAAAGTLANGVTYATTAPAAFAPGRQSDGAAWWGVALFPNPTVPTTRWTFNQPVNVDFSVAMTYSTGTAVGENTVQLPAGAVALSLPTGYSYNQTTHVLTAGPALNSAGCPLNSPTRAASARFRVTGVSTFTLKYLGPRVLSTVCQRFGTWEFGALDVSLGGPFLRTVCRDCTGAVTSTTDTLLDGETPYTPTGLVGVCPTSAEEDEPAADRDVELIPMCVVDNGTGSILQRVLAQVVYDTTTGDRVSVSYVDPVTWGPVPVPGGARIDVCLDPDPTEPCGDTEIAQLCDLTYDPQAPIATPAADFALTGNVVVGNAGTTLWFAQANQEANGTAELTVSGLLPAVMYQFRFASAWIGAGAPNPVANAAIYELEILDGATVLASRTRNVSNGSAVFPGGTLTEDMPPVAFIAPATGAVTIRFTDQTTGGPINDRDLFLMPLEVRTAVLTLKSTPFLRRFTFDCDGTLTSREDVGLDGTTPYDVEGEVGSCTADGGTTAAVSSCDVQNVLQACRCDDTDGDGIADTDYVELLGVDCDGALTALGTFLPDLSAPYAPVAPLDCDQTDEGAPPAVGVQARRLELAAGASWSAADYPTLQSVTAVAHAGTGTVTTVDGASTLHTSEAATWSVGRTDDALLTGPLNITADTGTVTITFTTGVTL